MNSVKFHHRLLNNGKDVRTKESNSSTKKSEFHQCHFSHMHFFERCEIQIIQENISNLISILQYFKYLITSRAEFVHFS